MKCRGFLLTISTILTLFSLGARATIVFVNPTIANTGASNLVIPPTVTTSTAGASPVPGASPTTVTGPSTATFYYSNISAQTHANPTTGVLDYFGDGTTQCSTAINQFCRSPSQSLTLNVTSSAATSNTPIMYLLYCAGAAPVQGQPISSCTILAQQYYSNGNAIPPLSVAWSSICSAAAANSTGTATSLGANCIDTTDAVDEVVLYLVADPTSSGEISSEYLSFNVYFDSTIPVNSSSSSTAPLGLYDFLAFPGDTQILIHNPLTDSTFPTSENTVGISGAKFYYYADTTSGTNTFNASNFDKIPTIATSAGFPSVTIGVTNTNGVGSLSSGVISNLTNGVRYYLNAALVDYAGNTGYQTPPYNAGADPTDNTISHSAVPDQIVGLIAQNGHCFVATAAFGSPLADEVQILRDFRDRYLMPHHWGRNFVSWYYKNSPELAAGIANDDDLRKLARTFLYPIVGFSWLALHWGATNALLFVLTLFSLPFLILNWQRLRPRFKPEGKTPG